MLNGGISQKEKSNAIKNAGFFYAQISAIRLLNLVAFGTVVQ